MNFGLQNSFEINEYTYDTRESVYANIGHEKTTKQKTFFILVLRRDKFMCTFLIITQTIRMGSERCHQTKKRKITK